MLIIKIFPNFHKHRTKYLVTFKQVYKQETKVVHYFSYIFWRSCFPYHGSKAFLCFMNIVNKLRSFRLQTIRLKNRKREMAVVVDSWLFPYLHNSLLEGKDHVAKKRELATIITRNSFKATRSSSNRITFTLLNWVLQAIRRIISG